MKSSLYCAIIPAIRESDLWLMFIDIDSDILISN